MIRSLAFALVPLISGAAIAQSEPEPAKAPSTASVASPDGSMVVTLATDAKGLVSYSIARRGKPIVNPSGLGFLLSDAVKLERDFRIDRVIHDKVDKSWTQPWGEWRTIRDNHKQMRVRLKETTALGRVLDVVFRVQDDGVGFRYEIPDQPNLKTVNIAEELTQFAFAQDATAWWKMALERKREEYLYNRTPLRSVGIAATPITLKLADGTHVALHEAALTDYAGMNVAKVGDSNTLKAVLTPGTREAKVTRNTPFVTPWRTLIITDDAPGLYMSHLMLNLNEPNKLGDVSWVRTGKFVGIWWKMLSGDWGRVPGPRYGAKTAHVKAYIDFAAANRIPYVLVESWNVGWAGQWFGNGQRMQFDTPTSEFDAAEVQRYAKAKGVSIVGHHETAGAPSHYEAQFDRAFGYARAHDIPSIKIGYVSDAGQLDILDSDGVRRRGWHEGQWMVNHYNRVMETAAKYRITINSHESSKGTGLSRTYPNWLTREGSRGMEYNAWADKNPPGHEATLAFTRMLEGPMDFTPGMFGLADKDGKPLLSTLAKQLALYVVLYSPLQMLSDTPENYARYPAQLQFLRDVPTDWADTRVLNGAVGNFITIARKDRRSNDWYLGSITNAEARTVEVKLDFLDPGRTYDARIYRDGDDATYLTEARHSIAIETRRVRNGDTITMRLAPGGGQAISLKVR